MLTEDLDVFKKKLKLSLSSGLSNDFFDSLYRHIESSSSLFNSIVQVNQRWKNHKIKTVKGVLSHDQLVLENNLIVDSALLIIDMLDSSSIRIADNNLEWIEINNLILEKHTSWTGFFYQENFRIYPMIMQLSILSSDNLHGSFFWQDINKGERTKLTGAVFSMDEQRDILDKHKLNSLVLSPENDLLMIIDESISNSKYGFEKGIYYAVMSHDMSTVNGVWVGTESETLTGKFRLVRV